MKRAIRRGPSAGRVAAAVCGLSATLVVLPTGHRGLVTAAAAVAALVIVAVATGWRVVGTLSVGLLTGLIAASTAAPRHGTGTAGLLAETALLLGYVFLLDSIGSARSTPAFRPLTRGRPVPRLLPALLALAAAAGVAATATQPV